MATDAIDDVVDDAVAEDDWGAAMAEQTSAESAALQNSGADQTQVFTEFTAKNKLQDTKMILISFWMFLCNLR